MDQGLITRAICNLLAGLTNATIEPLSPTSAQADIDWAGLSMDEWRILVEIALKEGVAPLLYWRIENGGCPEIPSAYYQQLQKAYYNTAAQNAMLFEELNRILGLLRQACIPVIVLKGADLAHHLYADPGLRPMSDLDLLIPYASFETALHLIEQSFGYQREVVETASELQLVVAYHTLLSGGANGLVKLELHWNLVASEQSWYAIPVAWFWDNSQPFHGLENDIQDPGRRLSNEANLLYLTAHAMLQHGGSQSSLIWLYDIHALVMASCNQINWTWLASEAKRLGWGCVLAAGLREVQSCFGTIIPEDVLVNLEQGADQRLSHLVKFKSELPTMRLLYDWYTLISLRWPDRLRYAARLIFPGHAYIQKRYQPKPGWTWPLFYLYRWGRMAWDALDALRKGFWRYNMP